MHPLLQCCTTERTTWEVKRYLPMISQRTEVSQADLLFLFETFPLTAYQSVFYDAHRALATRRIAHRDPKDINILALTYQLQVPLWTADPDLLELSDIQTVATDQLRRLLPSIEV